ncbi:MAG: methyltransferase domain-containing protein, partial [Euryarchaeota archaeon]|nr:methyltransferase domain-containing protein [Euryarchaeota archaeon]
MARRLPGGSRVVDLGCGSGRNALFLARRGHRVVGVDYVEEALRAARGEARRRRVDRRVRFYRGDLLAGGGPWV